jgi:hypothetical protein
MPRTEINNRLRWFFQRTSSFRSWDKLIYREELDSGYDDPPTLRWRRPVADCGKNTTANLVIRGLVMQTWATCKDHNPIHLTENLNWAPNLSKIRWIWEPWIYIYRGTTLWTVALKRPIFKRKKGFANLSLGLIYHSKALPQPPSHDTVPLNIIVYYTSFGCADLL